MKASHWSESLRRNRMMGRLNIGTQMNFSRQDLLERLVANRDRHASVVKEALAGYVKRARDEVVARLNELEKGRPVALYFSLQPPADMTSAYDTVIEMLRMSQDRTIELSAQEFRCLVQDEWDWSELFWSTNKTYSQTAKSVADSKGI
jgi:hypothetical protein